MVVEQVQDLLDFFYTQIDILRNLVLRKMSDEFKSWNFGKEAVLILASGASDHC